MKKWIHLVPFWSVPGRFTLHYCYRYKACITKKKTLALVFSCEFYKSSKNTFPYRTPLVAASKSLT